MKKLTITAIDKTLAWYFIIIVGLVLFYFLSLLLFNLMYGPYFDGPSEGLFLCSLGGNHPCGLLAYLGEMFKFAPLKFILFLMQPLKLIIFIGFSISFNLVLYFYFKDRTSKEP